MPGSGVSWWPSSWDFGAFSAVAHVQDLVQELKSHKLHSIAKKKKDARVNSEDLWSSFILVAWRGELCPLLSLCPFDLPGPVQPVTCSGSTLFQIFSMVSAYLSEACLRKTLHYVSNLNFLLKFIGESCSVISNSLWPHGLYSPWNSPGQNTGVGSLSLLWGIFPTQGSNPGLLHCKRILYQLSHKG